MHCFAWVITIKRQARIKTYVKWHNKLMTKPMYQCIDYSITPWCWLCFFFSFLNSVIFILPFFSCTTTGWTFHKQFINWTFQRYFTSPYCPQQNSRRIGDVFLYLYSNTFEYSSQFSTIRLLNCPIIRFVSKKYQPKQKATKIGSRFIEIQWCLLNDDSLLSLYHQCFDVLSDAHARRFQQ